MRLRAQETAKDHPVNKSKPEVYFALVIKLL